MSVLQRHYQWGAICAIYQTLRAKGYQAFLAGGCVRDALLGTKPKDLDIATDATPETVESLFPRTVNVGKAFGVIRVLIEGCDIEVATFRQDGDYQDGRHPSDVTFSTPEEDAQRRDFTINALFLDPGVEAVLDFVEGEKDLTAGRLRAVGDAEKRFSEDYLRMLRALRFAGQLGFEIEERTFAALKRNVDKVSGVSAERITEEMGKLLQSPFRDRALALMRESGLMNVLFPFRAEENSFSTLPTREKWKLWSLFFLPLRSAPQETLEKNLDVLRLPNRDRKNILATHRILFAPKDFFSSSFGQRLQLYAEASVRWACQILSYEGQGAYQKEIERLELNWLNLDEKLPDPFLKGEDVVSYLKGPRIGECLREAYALQLEGRLLSREEALDWMGRNY